MITISTILVFGLFGGVFGLVPAMTSVFSKNEKVNKIMSTVGMVGFGLLASMLLLPSIAFEGKFISLNFIPTSKWFSKTFTLGFAETSLRDVVINSLMLAPMGLMLTQKLLAKKDKGKKKSKIILKSLLAGFIMGACVEICQMILPFDRVASILDIALNALSATLGSVCLLACHGIKNFFESRKKNKKGISKNNETIEANENVEVKHDVKIKENVNVDEKAENLLFDRIATTSKKIQKIKKQPTSKQNNNFQEEQTKLV